MYTFHLSFINVLFDIASTEYPSYTQMRKEREEFRKFLVKIIVTDAAQDADVNAFPNAEERKIFRYYHYIRNGIDTAHVAPLASKVLKK